MVHLAECKTRDGRFDSSRLAIVEKEFYPLLITGSIQEDRKSSLHD